jgi:hypothetical protein
MRHRERVIQSDTAHLLTERWETDYRLNPSYHSYEEYRNEDITSLEKTEVMDDVVTPRWDVLVNSGGIANNPMTQVVRSIRDDVVTVYIAQGKSVRRGTSPDYEWGDVAAYNAIGTASSFQICEGRDGYLPIPTYDQSHWRDLALTKCWANVRLDEAQVLIMIGESRKTILSMISMFRRLIKIIKSIKRLDVRALKHELSAKELANRYMELRYAIRPLMYDFNGMVRALKHEAAEAKSRLTFRGHEYLVEEDSDVRNFNNGYTYQDGDRSYDCERTSKVSCDVRAGVLTQLETVSHLPIWGLANPIEAAWELIPFSFIIDWFVNVGNTIAAWTPNYGLTTLASWTVVREIKEQTFRITRTYTNIGYDTEGIKQSFSINRLNNCYCSDTVITTVRTPNPSRPILPTITVNLNVFKLIDLLIITKYLVGK